MLCTELYSAPLANITVMLCPLPLFTQIDKSSVNPTVNATPTFLIARPIGNGLRPTQEPQLLRDQLRKVIVLKILMLWITPYGRLFHNSLLWNKDIDSQPWVPRSSWTRTPRNPVYQNQWQRLLEVLIQAQLVIQGWESLVPSLICIPIWSMVG